MVGPVGGSRSVISFFRSGSVGSKPSKEADRAGSTGNLKRSVSLSDLNQTDSSSPVASGIPLSVSSKGAAAQKITKLSMLEKKGEPSYGVIKEMQPYAVASKSIYSSFDGQLSPGWKQITPSEGALAHFKTVIPRLTIDPKGHFSTPEGLVAGLFTTDNNQVCLAFGGTTSGEVTGGTSAERSIAKLGLSGKQWLANTKNALTGTKPVIYQQAAQLTKLVAESNLGDFNQASAHDPSTLEPLASTSTSTIRDSIVLTGHSLGGGLAQYSATSLGTPEKPVACFGFCSAELGKDIRKEIKEKCGNVQERFDRLVAGIKNLKIKGDIVPNMHNIFGVTAVGRSYTINPTPEAVKKGTPEVIDFHTNYLAHIDSYIDTRERKGQTTSL